MISKLDIHLVERCIVEKWNPISAGCMDSESVLDHCPLCLHYWDNKCLECPIKKRTGEVRCRNTPLDRLYAITLAEVDEDYSMSDTFWVYVEKMVEFLVEMLPEDHPWRKI